MKKDIINVTKYTFESNFKELYDVFLIPEKDDSMNFYIQKQGYGIISHGVGIQMKDFKKLDSVEDFIDANLNEWMENCEHDIETLEQ